MFGFKNRDDYQQARDVLARGDYSFDAISETLGKADWLTPRALDAPAFEYRTSEAIPHQTLIRLLLLGNDVPVDEVQRALDPMSIESWVDANVLVPSRTVGELRSRLRVVPIDDVLYAADSPRVDAAEAPDDFVMPPGGTSLQLSWSAIQRESVRTLDVGTGCGYLGLCAAGFSEQIIASDCNQRAVDMARFNAMLNGIQNFEAKTGSLFEPVADDHFDLILSNPPFVITPEYHLMLRDSGVRGDEFCQRLIREGSQHLNDGGYLQTLGNCTHRTGRKWKQDLTDWFNGIDCDAVVFVTRQQKIQDYAMEWITMSESQDPTVVPGIFSRWMRYYEDQQIEEVSYLHISIQRRAGGSNWTFIDDQPVKIVGECGKVIQRRFQLLQYLNELASDESMLDERFVVEPRARLIQEHLIQQAGPKVAANHLEMRGGLQYTVNLDVYVTRLLVYCDGQASLRELLTAMAADLGGDFDRVASIALPAVRHLIERGILMPARMITTEELSLE